MKNCTILRAGFERSNHYKLDCNVRFEFHPSESIQNFSHTYDITPDETCDSRRGEQDGVNLFKVNLVMVDSTNPFVGIDFDNAEATVFIDDSVEEECSELLCIQGTWVYICCTFNDTMYCHSCDLATLRQWLELCQFDT